MQLKTIIGGLIAGVVSFFLGWLVWGLLLDSYYSNNVMHYPGLEKAEPVMWTLALGNFVWGLLISYIVASAGIKTALKGFFCGLTVYALVSLGYNLFNYSFMNLMGLKMSAVDAAINGLFGGVLGAVMGWWHGRGNNAVTY
jgi:hypothetical protein